MPKSRDPLTREQAEADAAVQPTVQEAPCSNHAGEGAAPAGPVGSLDGQPSPDRSAGDARSPTSEDTQPADEADLRARLDEASRQRDEYLDLARRTKADFANFRRRTEVEQQQRAREANLGMTLKLLNVLDDFERALATATPEDLDSSWGKGVQLMERNLRGLLASEDVQPIQAQGAEFNPWEHEAVTHLPTGEAEEGTVLQVVRTGYRKGDRVIRPAQVVVARRPA